MATATKQKRPIRPIISRSVGDAAGQTVLDALDAGYSIDELTMVAMLSEEWDKSNPPIVQVGEIPKPFKIK